MDTLTRAPDNIPAVVDGVLTAFSGKYARNVALAVVHMSGGAEGLLAWKNRNPANETDFWTKIFPKTIQKEVEVSDRRSIEDVLAAIDGEFTVVDNPVPAVPIPQGMPSFDTAIVVGDLDDTQEEVVE